MQQITSGSKFIKVQCQCERQTDRQRQRQRDSERHRERQLDRQRQTETERNSADRQRGGERERGRQTNGQRERRQTDSRQTEEERANKHWYKLTRMLPAFKLDTNILEGTIQTFGLPSVEFLHVKDSSCLWRYIHVAIIVKVIGYIFQLVS